MNNLGAALAAARQFGDAVAAQEQAIALLRTAGEELVAGAALTDLGVALRGARRFDEAISAHESAAAIARKAAATGIWRQQPLTTWKTPGQPETGPRRTIPRTASTPRT